MSFPSKPQAMPARPYFSDKMGRILGVPEGYKIGIVPASDTGAVEMAMWSMLGARPVDVLTWESFGAGWATDITKQLKLDDVAILNADYGELPDLNKVRPDADVVFTWNGTTSGARVPNADWISQDRTGLTICDATSGAFAQDLDWPKLDVVTFSWQKAMGGEGAHGVLILSPRAVERLESYTPDRPLPKIFRLTKGGKLIDGIFTGATINTPSMLCVADAEDALEWMDGLGGLSATMARVCLKITDPDIAALEDAEQKAFVKKMVALLDSEGAAFDIGGYRDAPAGLRIWCGATVDTADVQALTPWLDWAFETVKNS